MRCLTVLVLLLAALAAGQTWIVEQIDSTAAAQSPVELVKAADGRLWAGYQADSGVARVACLTDSGWGITDVCKATVPLPFDRPFLAAGPHGELCLSCYGDSGLCRLVSDTWQREPYPDSTFGTVAYDTAGRLHGSYERQVSEFWAGHQTDSGWTSGLVVYMGVFGYFYITVECFTVAADGSPWDYVYTFWDWSQHVWSEQSSLMHQCGDTWVEVRHGSDLPLAIVPHGDSVGYVTIDSLGISCDGEHVAGVVGNSVGGLAYTAADVPLVAWVPRFAPADIPFFAFKTNRWHVEAIPGPAGVGGVDIEVNDIGQVVIVYSTEDSGLWCARGADVVGARESPEPQASSWKPMPTIIRGVLFLPKMGTAPSGAVPTFGPSLLDISGRNVLDLHAGANDVRALAPGVYFIRAVSREPSAVGCQKVVIAR
jgi:hypothetical protein